MLSKGTLKFINSLHIKKYRQQHNLFTVEGEKNILELLESDFIIDSLFITEKASVGISDEFVDYTICDKKSVEKASFFKTNDFGVALVKIPLKDSSIRSLTGWSLALDEIKDPGNLGTILRTADWYGVHTIICSDDCVDAYNPKVIAASMGSFCRVNVHYVDLEKTLLSVDQPIYGAILGGNNLHKNSINLEKGIVLMGNESKGIRVSLQQLCTKKLMIPSFGRAESLNVAVATAILLDNLKRINP